MILGTWTSTKPRSRPRIQASETLLCISNGGDSTSHSASHTLTWWRGRHQLSGTGPTPCSTLKSIAEKWCMHFTMSATINRRKIHWQGCDKHMITMTVVPVGTIGRRDDEIRWNISLLSIFSQTRINKHCIGKRKNQAKAIYTSRAWIRTVTIANLALVSESSNNSNAKNREDPIQVEDIRLAEVTNLALVSESSSNSNARTVRIQFMLRIYVWQRNVFDVRTTLTLRKQQKMWLG